MATNRTSGPKVACEISAERVIAARGSGSALDIYTTRNLPTGTLMPGLGSHNILRDEALRDALSASLSTVGGGKDVVAVIPDAAVRVLLIDFETLPNDREEAEALIRFRVRKSLPFDVEQAALSFHAQRGNGTVRVLAALSPRIVIAEYEDAFRALGYSPGVVVPSILATLGMVSADRPTMVVKVDPITTSIAIVDGDQVQLLRTLDHPGRTVVSATELANSIHPSMVFYEDTYAAKIELILLGGTAELGGLASTLESESGVRTCELSTGAGSSLGDNLSEAALAGVAGALAP